MVDLPNREVDKHGTGTSDLGTGQHPSHLVERNVSGHLWNTTSGKTGGARLIEP